MISVGELNEIAGEDLTAMWLGLVYEPARHERDRSEMMRLIADVREVCLSGDLAEKSHTDDLDDRLVLPGLGRQMSARAARAALALQSEQMPAEAKENAEVLKNPHYFAIGADVEIAREVRALGEEFLEQAWNVLGDGKESRRDAFNKTGAYADTPENRHRLRGSKLKRITDDGTYENAGVMDDETADRLDQIWREQLPTQTDVVLGVMERLEEISKKNPDEGSRDFFYHPARLSPKLIGEWPDTHLDPTCLSKAIIMASFLHHCGARTMLAGVMEVEAESFWRQVSQDANKELDQKIPEAQRYNFFMRGVVQRSTKLVDSGYHAAVMAEIDGAWAVVDPNYHRITRLNDEATKRVETAYHDIHDFYQTTAGLELAIDLDNQTDYLGEVLALDAACDLPLPEQQAVEDYLANMSDESVLQGIYEAFVFPCEYALFDEDKSGNSLLVAQLNARLKLYNEPECDVLKDAAAQFFGLMLLGDEPLQIFIERCRADVAYRARRADDIVQLCRAAKNLKTLRDYYDIRKPSIDSSDKSHEHKRVELGETAEAIGLRVLNDFAQYTDADISPDMWLSQWSSDVAVSENVSPEFRHILYSDDEIDPIGLDEQRLASDVLLLGRRTLRYIKNYGMI